jgi:peroxiredoxin
MAMPPRLLLGCLLLIVACSSPLAGQSLTPLPGAMPAPDFELPDTDGKLHRLSDYRGKTVIINFWTTWCPPCREEIPSMNRAWQQLRQEDVVMLAINMGEDEDTIFVFNADYPAEFPLLLDRDGAVIARWPVKGLPTTYIIAPDGSIAYRAIGGRNWDDSDIMDTLRALQKQR